MQFLLKSFTLQVVYSHPGKFTRLSQLILDKVTLHENHIDLDIKNDGVKSIIEEFTDLLLNPARGFHWQELIDEGEYPNIKELAKAIGIDPGVAAKAIRLTLLSPKIIHKLITGEADISMQTLRRSFPMIWSKLDLELL